MKRSGKIIIGVVVLLVIIVFININNNKAPEPGKYAEFAQCLTDNGAIFYGAFWCPHCNDQKESFGEDFQYVTYVECSLPSRAQNQVCNDASIEAYPTWEFADGSRVEGALSFPQLAEKTGCVLP